MVYNDRFTPRAMLPQAGSRNFDLRTFSIRAYPVDKVPELRPGMSAYLDWRARG